MGPRAPGGGSANAGRPITAFLSYARENATRAQAFQRQLRFRGVRVWRDVTNLSAGVHSPAAIEHAIRDESDAFVLYVTPEFLLSDFIWRVEIPAAVARRESDPLFRIIPIFDGLSPAKLTARCSEAGQIDLSDFNGGFAIARGKTRRAALKGLARATLEGALVVRFQADQVRPITVCLQCAPLSNQLENPDLCLDWSEAFTTPCPSQEAWESDLLPALRDVREVVAGTVHSRRLVSEVHARLSAALAFGHAMSDAAKLTLVLRDKAGDWTASRGCSELNLLRSSSLAAVGDAKVAVLEVAISRDTTSATTEAVSAFNIDAGRRVRMAPLAGSGNDAIEGPVHAADMARQVANTMRSMHDNGVKVFHLFVAAPPAWSALLGHLLNAVGEVVAYQWDSPSGYQRACTLR